MPLPSGIGFNAPGSGNVDFAGIAESLSALQHNPQVRRASGIGALNLTGSVVYAVLCTGGTVSLADMSGTFATAVPSFTFDQGVPTVNPSSGGALTITPSNLSTVSLLVLYK